MHTERVAPLRIFCCYAREDESLKNDLKTHIASLVRNGLVEFWDDRCILPGEDWRTAIEEKLSEAAIILLLISSDFMASEYCYNIELKHALARHAMNQSIVIPIIARPVHWENSPIGKIQALPKDAKPITQWDNADEAWYDVIVGIRAIVEKHNQLHFNHVSKSKTNTVNRIVPIFLGILASMLLGAYFAKERIFATLKHLATRTENHDASAVSKNSSSQIDMRAPEIITALRKEAKISKVDTSKLRSGIALGFELARLEFFMDSPFPMARAIRPSVEKEVLDMLALDGYKPRYRNFKELMSGIMRKYSSSDSEKFAAIMIGISALRLSLTKAKTDTDSIAEMTRIAFSALQEIDDELLPAQQKEIFFNNMKKSKPEKIVHIVDFVKAFDASQQ